MITTKTYVVTTAYTTPWNLSNRRVTHYHLSNPSDAYDVAMAGGWSSDTHFTQVNELTVQSFSVESITPIVSFSESIEKDKLMLMAEGYKAIKLDEQKAKAAAKLEKSLTDVHVIDDTRLHPIPRK
jgi:hypothetical protein